MVKRLLGSATTDSNGVATLSYTGVGAGKLNVVAELSSTDLTSDTYELLDYLAYDKGITGDKSSDWVVGEAVTVSTNELGTTLSVINATLTSGYNVSTKALSGDFEMIVYIENEGTGNSNKARFGVTDGTNRSFVQSNTGYVKFKRLNGVYSAQISSDGETWSDLSFQSDNASTTSDVYCIIGIYANSTTEATLLYKDLIAYHI